MDKRYRPSPEKLDKIRDFILGFLAQWSKRGRISPREYAFSIIIIKNAFEREKEKKR